MNTFALRAWLGTHHLDPLDDLARPLRKGLAAFGGWKVIGASGAGVIAGAILSGVIFYPVAMRAGRQSVLNKNAIVVLEASDASIIAGILSMTASQRQRDDWQELQICAQQQTEQGRRALVLTYSMTAELRERCQAAAERLARRY